MNDRKGPLAPQAPISKHHATEVFAKASPNVYRDPYVKAESLKAVKFNNVGSKLACFQSDRNVRIWQLDKPDSKSATELRVAHQAPISSISWNPLHADLIVTCSKDDPIVKEWDVRSTKCVRELDTGASNTLVKHSTDGKHLAFVTEKDVQIRDADNWERTLAQQNFEHKIVDLAWSNNPTVLAVALETGTVMICAVDTINKSILVGKELQGHRSVNCLEFDARGRYLATGSNEGVISFWDVSQWMCVDTFTGLDEAIVSMSFSFESEYLAVGTESTTTPVTIIHVRSGEIVHKVQRAKCVAPPAISWHPLNYIFAVTGDNAGMTVFR
uniref:ARAD1D02178p n=1 Tax=Blastobotrys adeninivorans TaxID=409370 RepID=A0A060TDR0_BLAAD